MPLSGMLTCGSCGARTQMNTMRYNLSGSKLICQGCVEKERSSIKPGTTHATSIRLQREQMQQKMRVTGRADNAPETAGLQQARAAGAAAAGEGGEGMVSYYCRMCHFKFSRKKDAEVNACPYCGRESVSQAYEGKAQDLIEEASGEEGELFSR
ncbi:hypothetical protein HYV85_04180 [Candidatus Woesearchaeota archaeon]|nr:hypothetical protein [Candidatus Woesearchaeota archaeon]